jgi:DNA invertase Pin-like site-specific DNA recombinase
MRFVLYARASTKDKQHPEHQIAELRTEAARRGWVVASEVIETESGMKDDRPKLQAALDMVLSGAADGLAAVELSRVGRSLAHLLKISKALDAAGRHLVCTRQSQSIDTTTPIGRLVFAVLGACAEFEAEIIRERVLAGVRAKRDKNGGSWGRGREAVPAKAVWLARNLRAEGMAWRTVASTLAAAGQAQPARDRGRSAHPKRPWPVGTLRDACTRVELPPSK